MTKNHHLLVYFVSTKHISHSSLKYLTSLETVLTLFLLPAIKNTVICLKKTTLNKCSGFLSHQYVPQ